MDVAALQAFTGGLVGISAGLIALHATLPHYRCSPNSANDAADCVRLNLTAGTPAIVGIPGSFWPYYTDHEIGTKFIATTFDKLFGKTCRFSCPSGTNVGVTKSGDPTPGPTTIPFSQSVYAVEKTPDVSYRDLLGDMALRFQQRTCLPSKSYCWYSSETLPDLTSYFHLPGDWELVGRVAPWMSAQWLKSTSAFAFAVSPGDPFPKPLLVFMVILSILALVFHRLHRLERSTRLSKAHSRKEASSREEERLHHKRTVEDLTQRLKDLEELRHKLMVEDLSQRLKELEELQRKANVAAINERIAQLEAEVSGKATASDRNTIHGILSEQNQRTLKHDKHYKDMQNRMADLERSVDGSEEDINRLNALDKTRLATISEFQREIKNRLSDFARSLDGTEEDFHRLDTRDNTLSAAFEDFKRDANSRLSDLARSLDGTEEDINRLDTRNESLLTIADYQRDMREREQAAKGLLLRLAALEEGSQRLDARNNDISVALSDQRRHCESHQRQCESHQRHCESQMGKQTTAIQDLKNGTIDLAQRFATLGAFCDDLSVEQQESRESVMSEIEKHVAAHQDLANRLTELQAYHDNLSAEQRESRESVMGKIEKHVAAHDDLAKNLTERFDNLSIEQQATRESVKGEIEKHIAAQKDIMAKHLEELRASHDKLSVEQRETREFVKAEIEKRFASHKDLDSRHKALDSLMKSLDSRVQTFAARQTASEDRSKEMRERVITACKSLGSWNHKAGEEFSVVLQNFEGFEGSMVAALAATFHALHHIHARVLPPGVPRPGFPGSPGYSPARPGMPQYPPGQFPQPQWSQGQWGQPPWPQVQAPHGLQGPVVQGPAPQSPNPQSPAAQGSPRQQGTPSKGPQAQTPSK